MIGREKVCLQQSEGYCADRGVSQIIWQSVERHRTSDSECPTTVMLRRCRGTKVELFHLTTAYCVTVKWDS